MSVWMLLFASFARNKLERWQDSNNCQDGLALFWVLVCHSAQRTQMSCNLHVTSSYPGLVNSVALGHLLCVVAIYFPVPAHLGCPGQKAIKWLLWPRCVADADIIFLSCSLFFLFASTNLSHHRLMSTILPHMMWP